MSTPEELCQAVERDDRESIAKGLRCLSSDPSAALPTQYLAATAEALETGDWSALTAPFRESRFVGNDGRFLILGPYTVRRSGCDFMLLSALYGSVIPHPPITGVEGAVTTLFGKLRQAIPVVLPVRIYGAAGAFGTEAGEAFIVPDGWAFSDGGDGPALNDMGEQRRRFCDAGRSCIRTLFEPDSAGLLLAPFEDEETAIQIQHREYQLHDAAHACGIGLKVKLADNLLTSPWYRAVEEWRADGVAFAIAERLFSPEEVSRLVASNLCVRLGVDAHRAGGVERDTDSNATLLTFSCLLAGGMLEIAPGGRLALTDPTPRGLVQAVELLRAEAVALTRRELKLTCPQGIWQLYGSIPLHSAACMLFKSYVLQPCRGMFGALK
jgi:hypothetical protein